MTSLNHNVLLRAKIIFQMQYMVTKKIENFQKYIFLPIIMALSKGALKQKSHNSIFFVT